MKNKIFSIVILTTSLFIANSVSANLITNGGFETNFTTSPTPTGYGEWYADPAKSVVAQNGIVPLEGNRMLKFTASSPYGNYTNTASNVWQLIDVSSYDSLISSGLAIASLSAYFNRVSVDNQTDTQFLITINSYSGDLGSPPNPLLNSLYNEFFTDSDVATWEEISLDMIVPVNTDYLAIQIAAFENTFNDPIANEFDGHYADLVILEIRANPVPEPSTMILLGAGLIGLAGWRRKRFRNN